MYALVHVMVCAIAAGWLANRVVVPYPIVLVLAGVALGFAYDWPGLSIDPTLVLAIVLPAVLYPAADAVRDAMMAFPAGAVDPYLPELRSRVDAAWSAWQGSRHRFTAVGEVLPGLSLTHGPLSVVLPRQERRSSAGW